MPTLQQYHDNMQREIPEYVRGHIYHIRRKSNPSDGYVGQTKTHQWRTAQNKWVLYGYMERYKQHIINANNPNKEKLKCRYLYNAICKYRSSDFEISLLEECSIAELDEREVYWIKTLNTLAPNGYNLESGGNKNKWASEETREKQRESKRLYNESEAGKLFNRENTKRLGAFNTVNNDNKKITKYADRAIDRIRVVYSPPESIVYIYIYCDGKSKRNKVRMRCVVYDDAAKTRIRNLIGEIRNENTKIEME